MLITDREDNVPGSDKVNVLVIVTSAEVETSCSLIPGPTLKGDGDAKGRSEWIVSSKSWVVLSNFYVVIVVVDFLLVNVIAACVGDNIAALPKVSAQIQHQSRQWPCWRTLPLLQYRPHRHLSS